MIVPGCLFDSQGRLLAEIDTDPVPAYIAGGFGFSVDGYLCLATDAPTGSLYNRGFRLTPAGAIYIVDGSDPVTVYEGYGFDGSGRLNVSTDAPGVFLSGEGFLAGVPGRLCVSDAS